MSKSAKVVLGFQGRSPWPSTAHRSSLISFKSALDLNFYELALCDDPVLVRYL